MRKPVKSTEYAVARRNGLRGDNERELTLLAEFTRSASVESLAGAIAARLGCPTGSDALLAEAGLAPRPREG